MRTRFSSGVVTRRDTTRTSMSLCGRSVPSAAEPCRYAPTAFGPSTLCIRLTIWSICSTFRRLSNVVP